MSSSSSPLDFDALLQHGRWVRALAHSLMADSAAAEDVAQRTWLAALESPPGKGVNPRAWLGGVVRILARNHWREQKARRRRETVAAEIREAKEWGDDGFDQPDFVVDRMDAVRKLASALAELPEPYRQTLYLRFFEELTIREIAKRMNAPESTTHARIHRGLALMRSELSSTLGKDWRQRCLVFTVPLTKVTSGGLITVLTMTLKTKVLVGLAALTLITLFTWNSWTPTDSGQHSLGEAVVALDAPRDETGIIGGEAATTIERSPFEHEASTNTAIDSAETETPFVVIVRDANTLEPVVNAEVFILDHMIEARIKALKPEEEPLDLEQKLERFGVMHTTDEAGEVPIPLPTGHIEIGARAGNQFAYFQQFANQKEDSSFAELLLRPVISQRVVVVDESGRPLAGVAVGLSIRNTAPFMLNSVVLETNNQGTVEFRHLEVLLAHSQNGQCTIGLRIPSAAPQFADAYEATIGKEDLRFVMPVTGGVQVACRYSNGKPLEDRTAVHLQLNHGKPIYFNDETVGRQTAWIKDGVATFEQVGIHTELLVRTYSTKTSQDVFVTGSGPTRLGEVSRLELIFPSEAPHLQVRALGPDRNPLSKTGIFARIDFFDRQSKWQRMSIDETSDENGWITLSVDEALKGRAEQARLLLYPSGRSETRGQVSFALLEFYLSSPPTDQEPLETTLGESLIVAGMVVDSEGNPAAAQRLSLSINDPRGTGSMSGTEIGRVELHTDNAGRFRFAGSVDYPQYSFSLHLDWGISIPFLFGQDDLIISQPEQGEISGRVLLDDPDWYKRLHVQAYPLWPEPGETEVLTWSALEQENGRFRITGVNLKNVRLQVRSSSMALAELVPVDEVVESSREGKQLPDWDLRGKVFEHVLHMEAKGTPHPTPLVLVSEYGHAMGHWEPGKPFTFFAPEAIVDFELRVDGYRPQEVRSNGEAKVVLVSGIPVRVVPPEGVPLPENSYWRMVLTATDSNNKQHSIHRSLVASVTDYPAEGLPFAGSWEVTLNFLMYSSWMGSPAKLPPPVRFENGSTSFAIDVKEADTEQTFAIPVTVQALKDALPPVPE
jgi:RNA polymerase sigma factor (sigma-70 family)